MLHFAIQLSKDQENKNQLTRSSSSRRSRDRWLSAAILKIKIITFINYIVTAVPVADLRKLAQICFREVKTLFSNSVGREFEPPRVLDCVIVKGFGNLNNKLLLSLLLEMLATNCIISSICVAALRAFYGQASRFLTLKPNSASAEILFTNVAIRMRRIRIDWRIWIRINNSNPYPT